VGVEQFLAVDLHAVRDADEADVAAGSGGVQGLLHRLWGADAFEDGVRADAVGHVLDAGHALVAAFGDDVGGAELGRELLPGLVPRHGDDPLRAEFLGRDDGGQADRAVADHRDGGAGPDLGGHGGVPAGAHDVGAGQQGGDVLVVGPLGGGDQGAVGQQDADVLGLAAARADELAVQAVALVAVAAVRAGVVGGEEGAHDELARLDLRDLAADFFDDASPHADALKLLASWAATTDQALPHGVLDRPAP
jgi:hypothetical protein